MKFTTPETLNEFLDPEDYSKYSKGMRRIILDIGRKVYIRSRLSEAQNHRCCWCGCLTTDERGKRNSSTIEHLVCLSHGGTDDIDNLAMACSYHNNKRGNDSVEVYLEKLASGLRSQPNYRARKKMTAIKKKERSLSKRFIEKHQDNRLVWG